MERKRKFNRGDIVKPSPKLPKKYRELFKGKPRRITQVHSGVDYPYFCTGIKNEGEGLLGMKASELQLVKKFRPKKASATKKRK